MEAAARLIPALAAVIDSTATLHSSFIWNFWQKKCRCSDVVLPSIRMYWMFAWKMCKWIFFYFFLNLNMYMEHTKAWNSFKDKNRSFANLKNVSQQKFCKLSQQTTQYTKCTITLTPATASSMLSSISWWCAKIRNFFSAATMSST